MGVRALEARDETENWKPEVRRAGLRTQVCPTSLNYLQTFVPFTFLPFQSPLDLVSEVLTLYKKAI